MDLSVSAKDEIWFLPPCHHVSNAVYQLGLQNTCPDRFIVPFLSPLKQMSIQNLNVKCTTASLSFESIIHLPTIQRYIILATESAVT